MNLLSVTRMLAGFAVFFSLAQLGPLAFALAEAQTAQTATLAGFAASILIGLAVSLLLWLPGRGRPVTLYRRDAIIVASVAWLLAGMLGAVPFVWSGVLHSPIDAIFETVSGLTTCGGTVLGTGGNPTPEQTPASILFWRALTQWLGGLGIVLVFVALLPGMGASGRNLLTSESVGLASDSFQPRALENARAIAGVYVLLTTACATCLVALGGMSVFEATCHAFTTMATGGYSTRTSISSFDSLTVEVILTCFMFVCGCSFALLATTFRQGFRGPGTVFGSSEFRTYAAFAAIAVTLVTIDLCRKGKEFGASLREASFNVASMVSCCGYATSDFQAWPPLSVIVIFTCVVVGGCSGSAAGGMKQVRFLIVLKLMSYQIRQSIRPKSVERLRLDGETLSAAAVSSALAMALMWLAAILLGAVVIAFDSRLDFVGALTASASMLGNAGPAMTGVTPETAAAALGQQGAMATTFGPNIGPLGGYGDLGGFTKIAMAFQMVLGRLELITLLALFTPSFWRK